MRRGELFYLFNVRYLHMMPFTLRGLAGRRPCRWPFAALVGAQFLSTHAPFMHDLFDTRPLTLADGILIVGDGVGLLVPFEELRP